MSRVPDDIEVFIMVMDYLEKKMSEREFEGIATTRDCPEGTFIDVLFLRLLPARVGRLTHVVCMCVDGWRRFVARMAPTTGTGKQIFWSRHKCTLLVTQEISEVFL